MPAKLSKFGVIPGLSISQIEFHTFGRHLKRMRDSPGRNIGTPSPKTMIIQYLGNGFSPTFLPLLHLITSLFLCALFRAQFRTRNGKLGNSTVFFSGFTKSHSGTADPLPESISTINIEIALTTSPGSTAASSVGVLLF